MADGHADHVRRPTFVAGPFLAPEGPAPPAAGTIVVVKRLMESQQIALAAALEIDRELPPQPAEPILDNAPGPDPSAEVFLQGEGIGPDLGALRHVDCLTADAGVVDVAVASHSASSATCSTSIRPMRNPASQ